MLINALCEYADKQKSKAGANSIPEGWAEQDIHYRIMLTSDGDIASIVDKRIEERKVDKKGKEKVTYSPLKIILPFRGKSTSISCYCGEHRPYYIFGLSYGKDGFTSESDKDKAKKSHDAFVKHELEFFDGLDSEMCIAYRRFVEKWNPENETENPVLMQLGKSYSNSYFGFGLTGSRGNLEDDEQFKRRYAEYVSNKSSDKDSDENKSFCGVLGEMLPIARIHENVKLPGGNTTGCVLVGMKEPAYTSYGKTQSYNSNVSEAAMKKYTNILNTLLSDRSHHKTIGDMTIVYFAMKDDDDMECELFTALMGDPSERAEKSIDKLFKFASGGASTPTAELGIDDKVTFYVAGLTPNSSRICQKFLCRKSFGAMIDNLIQHQNDLRIKEDSSRQIFFQWIAKELLSPKSTKDKVPPPLMSGIMLAAFNGTEYPVALLETVVRRVKTDSDEEKNPFIKLNDTRAGIIKACINRKLRRKGQKEEITMSLNTENMNPAYLCGRLFAVLEKIQQDSSGGGLNRTIKDSYFASACARPSSVMTKLIQLSQNHMRKLSEGSCIYYNKLIGEIMNGLEGSFPQTLDLDSQGRFIIGYYQQNKDLYTSKNHD